MIPILAIVFTTLGTAAEPASKPAAPALEQRILERDVTRLLYQYSTLMAEKGGDPLKDLEPKNPYFIGYLHFKRGDEDKAKSFFEQAIAQGTFSPASRYMLAYVALKKFELDGSARELSEAESQLERAIAEDPGYSSPYYLRGIISWKHKGQVKEALANLAKAAQLNSRTCQHLGDLKEINSSWRRTGTKEVLPGLEKVRQDCAKTAAQ